MNQRSPSEGTSISKPADLSIDVFFITANHGRGVGTPEFERNLREVLHLAQQHRYWVVFLQEIDEADAPKEHKILKDIAEQQDFRLVGMSSHVPMAISKSLITRDAKVYFGAPGLIRLSPNRHFNTVRVRPDIPKFSEKFEFNLGCTHFPRWTPVLFTRWRTLRKKMEKVMRAEGGAWFYGMDCNVYGWKLIFPAVERVLVKLRLDRIQVVMPKDAGFKLSKKKVGHLNLTIDGHDAPWALMKLTAKD